MKETQQKQEEFRIITDNMSEGFIVINEQLKILTYNQSALKLLGAEVETPDNILKLSRSEVFREAIHKSLEGEHQLSKRGITEKW